MRAEEQFDSFYLKTRRALVHQTFALTGDLAAAQKAVRDAYVGAWHHWRKVRAHEDPRDWVRPRAWAQAQRRHTARLWQRTRDLSVEDREVLDALHKLPLSERRALVMMELAGAPAEVAARELVVTQEALERQHRSAVSAFTAALGVDPADVRAPLTALGNAATDVSLPRAAGIRREGRARRRTNTLAAAVATTFLVVGTGAFAHDPGGETATAGQAADSPGAGPRTQVGVAPEQKSTLPSAADLLGPQDAKRLDPKAEWQIAETSDNTSGDGINYVCQQQRFADPHGLSTIVREMNTSGNRPVDSMVQTVEISKNADAAAATYSTVMSWFAGCDGGDLFLKRAFDVTGIADHAALLELESWSRPRTTYSVGVAEVGQVVSTSVVKTVDGTPPGLAQVAKTLGVAGQSICEREGRSSCGAHPDLQYTAPAPSGEAPGVLATVDMPPLVGVGRPWVGTDPAPAGKNLAATSCDRADFRKEGAARARTRTFLVPEAHLPARFGLTETYGTFKSTSDAASFIGTIRRRFAGCEDHNLATKVIGTGSLREGRIVGAIWRLRTELSQSRDVVFDVGFVRHGTTVAQVTFVPAGPADLPAGAFRSLVLRAGQRLAELQ